MGLLINQGKQKIQAPTGFDPIEQPNAQLAVEKLEIDKFSQNSLRVTMRILDGNHKNSLVFDTISYDPTSKFAWKYQAFRSACGVPYTEDEPAQIDIETLLLNRVLKADLSIRKYTGKDGTEKEGQNFKYKAAQIKQAAPSSVTVTSTASTSQYTTVDNTSQAAVTFDDDLPFNSAEEKEQPIKTAEEKAPVEATVSTNTAYDDWD